LKQNFYLLNISVKYLTEGKSETDRLKTLSAWSHDTFIFVLFPFFWYFWQPAGEGTKMTRQLETTQRFFYKFIFIKFIHTYIKINKIVNTK